MMRGVAASTRDIGLANLSLDSVAGLRLRVMLLGELRRHPLTPTRLATLTGTGRHRVAVALGALEIEGAVATHAIGRRKFFRITEPGYSYAERVTSALELIDAVHAGSHRI